MNRVTASSLSAETARVDRSAGERRGRDDAPAAGAGSGGFAGLLRAAGVQPAAQPAPGEAARAAQAGARRTDAAPQPPRTAPAAAAPAPVARPPGSSADAKLAEAKSAEARARADRPRAAGAGAGADASRQADESRAKEAPAEDSAPAEAAPSGGATVSHWMMQLAAQRHGGIGAALGRAAAQSAAGAPLAGSGDGAAAAAGGAAASLNLPSWARPEDAGAGAGVWAGGGQALGGRFGSHDTPAAETRSAQPLEAGATRSTPDAGPSAAVGSDAAPGFASQLAALVGGAPPPAAASPAPVGEAFVQTPVGAPGFGDEVMVKVAAFSLEGIQEARLDLNPAELGPIQVRIALDGNQARIDFGATTGSTRELLEQALPALAEALQADGLQLAASSVVSEVSDADAAFGGAGSGRDEAGAGAGQGDAGSGRPGGWGQQSESGAAPAGRGPLPAGSPLQPGRGGDAPPGWGEQRPADLSSGLRGLDLYA